MTPQYAAVLVNYNAGDELRVALQSIADDMGEAAWEAVVVDNASHDGSAAAAQAFGSHVRLIANAVNVGFGAAVNQGLAAATAPFVLIMNPDCRLGAGALDLLRAALDAHPSCAVAGPRILDPDGSVQGSARGDPDMLTGLFGRTGALRRLLPTTRVATRNVIDATVEDVPPVVVDWVSGACMLVRRTAFEDAGGFDERYFLYWEDADLCRRLRAAGHHVRYVPGALAVHSAGHSSRMVRAQAIRWFHESAYRYYVTHVATRAWDARRPMARVLLGLRCQWRLFALRAAGDARRH